MAMELGRNAAYSLDADIDEIEGPHSINAEVRMMITETIITRLRTESLGEVEYDRMVGQIEKQVEKLAVENRYQVSAVEQRLLAEAIADDMLRLGPLEKLLEDETITDILVNGPEKVFVDRIGTGMRLTNIRFRGEEHLRSIADRIVRTIGRKLDDTSPMVDARLVDGSRVNIVIPPISIDGTAISIRKFRKADITFDTMVMYGSMSQQMAEFLEIAAKSRLNILISGGTGSGKTTLLNAITRYVPADLRILTIEDSAELRLQQAHVLRLETRVSQNEGQKEISQRDLVKNALRQRPEIIILGEVRGGEAIDLLSAMNTGHDGSMGTIHANTPRDAISRLETLVLMAGYELPHRAIRGQIQSAVNLIVQTERMIDRTRRITKITEVVGLEGETITTQDLFSYETHDNVGGKLKGEFICHGVNLQRMHNVSDAGLERELRQVISGR